MGRGARRPRCRCPRRVRCRAAAGADGRRGTVIFGSPASFLIAGLVVSSGVYPAALVALAVAFSFSLAGHHVAPGGVIGASALLLLVDQLTAWSFDAATGATSAAATARSGWLAPSPLWCRAGSPHSCSRPATFRCRVASLPR
jgi:hypothetical protein